MRRLIRWALYLFIVLVVLGVAAILLLNTIAKQVLESRLRANTGMDVRIGQVDVGLLSPTVTIDNLKIYKSADFGGSVFIDIPELHVEYDPAAIRSHKLHFTLVRLDLAELSLVQDKQGRSNVRDLDRHSGGASRGQKSSGADFKFTGIDTLNLTLGKFRKSDLGSGRGEEIQFGIKNQISHNVNSEADLGTLNFVLTNRSRSNSSATNTAVGLGALLKGVTGL
jgi:uncharacterized protein involved in outer membrane biogenesis